MKRTIPLLITATVGAILIASRFIPRAQSWGETAAIWFDILAAIAFVLGGGSLFKLHLKKISDRNPGWAYSAITLLAFLVELYVGVAKTGAPSAAQQEFYGWTFAPLDVADLPESAIARVAGTIPRRPDREALPLSVRRQLRQEGDQLVFRGWMSEQQRTELAAYDQTLAWQCAVERLFDASQPEPPLAGAVRYMPDHRALAVEGVMSDEVRAALLKMGGNERWLSAVESLDRDSHRVTQVAAPPRPAGFQIPASMPAVHYDDLQNALSVQGPMSMDARDRLARASFPLARPLPADARGAFRDELESHGRKLNAQQAKILDNQLRSGWTVDELIAAIEAAAKSAPKMRSACEQLAQPGGPPVVEAPAQPPAGLNDRQRQQLAAFAADENQGIAALVERLRAAGPLSDRQAQAIETFFEQMPTSAERRLALAVALLRAGPLRRAQRDFLLDDYRSQFRWRQAVGRLFVAAHVPKYPWSGQYNVPQSAFGWMYEFVFKPLTATMFGLLAFYVASAAFRAFRAKNLEAILLLGTAFIMLLGQTFAGYWLTSWLPEDPRTNPLALLRIENLKILIMSVFTTAGTRAIMIGIALGLASTSLKILLGIDRSHLGGD
jgi:hypothetical protein